MASGLLAKIISHSRARLAHDLLVVFHIVHAGEGVLHIAELLAVFAEREHVAPGIDAGGVKRVLVEEVVSDLVAGIAQLYHDLLRALGDAAQAYREAVPGEYREHDADGPAAELRAHVGGDVVDGGVVAVRAGNDALGHRDDVRGHAAPKPSSRMAASTLSVTTATMSSPSRIIGALTPLEITPDIFLPPITTGPARRFAYIVMIHFFTPLVNQQASAKPPPGK